MRGAALYRCGRFEEAVRQIHRWDGRRPDFWVRSGLDASLLAMALHRLGREDDARRALEDAEAAQSRAARAILEHDGHFNNLLYWEDWAGGLALRREAEVVIRGEAGPDPPQALLATARLYAKLGRAELAEAGFRAAVAAAPDDPEIWLAWSEICAELGDRDRAADDSARAAALLSPDPTPWIRHGRRLADAATMPGPMPPSPTPRA